MDSETTTLFICVTCRAGGERFYAAVRARADGLDVVPVECLSNCERSCSAAVAARGKWTYVIGDLDPDQHADDILEFARAHQAHADGLPLWRERPRHIRKHTIARVPPMERILENIK